MKWIVGIIVIVVVCAVYVLFSGKYKQDEMSEDKSKIGWGESGEAGSNDVGDD